MTEREIFFEALEMTRPEARAAYLQGVCCRHGTLRRKMDELLREHLPDHSLIAGPAMVAERNSAEVWLAEQREPVKRRVALKIIKLGMDNQIRFELSPVSPPLL